MKYIIVVDKQPRTNPSKEKRETTIDIEELRKKGDVHDDFKIEKGIAKVYRRVGLTKYHVTYILDKEVIEELGKLRIKLFKGTNYIYVKDEYNNQMCAEFVIDNEFNDRYITNLQMESAIEETASQIKLYVGQILEGYSDTETTKAMIDLKADEIREEVSRDYATQNALEQEKSERVQTANSITQSINTLKKNVEDDYSTTVQMNSAITQKANEITSSVSSTYETKTGVDTKINTAKSQIKQTTDSISTEVSKKVGKNEVISSINQSSEAVTINANKVNLSGYVTVSNLQTAGKTIINGSNITTGTIDASKAEITNINADNITAGTIKGRAISGGTITGSQITGGNITLTDSNGNQVLRVMKPNNTRQMAYITPFSTGFNSEQYGTGVIELWYGGESIEPYLQVSNGNKATYVRGSGITTPTLTQTSLKSKKKNIKKLDVNATELIKNSNICLYNLKGEKAKSKKHIGLVIGKGYNCPIEVIAEDGQGVEQYSMTSLAWKAIQELTEENNKLKQRIEKLEAREEENNV